MTTFLDFIKEFVRQNGSCSITVVCDEMIRQLNISFKGDPFMSVYFGMIECIKRGATPEHFMEIAAHAMDLSTHVESVCHYEN